MESASWATLTLHGRDEKGRGLIAVPRVVICSWPDRPRSILVPWWPGWAYRNDSIPACPN